MEMNEEQRNAAIRLATLFVAGNQDIYDDAYNKRLAVAGSNVKLALQSAQQLSDVDVSLDPMIAEIVAFVREKLYPQGEVLNAIAVPSIIAEQKQAAREKPRQTRGSGLKQAWGFLRGLFCFLALLLWACGAQAQAVYNPPATGGGTSLLSARVVYLSKASIVADGATDQTTALQTIYNTNSAGGSLEVVNDLTGVVYTGTLTVYANTTTRTLPGGKWKLKTNAQGPLFKNATPRRSIPTALLAPTDSNIKFFGGYFDGNNRGFSANGTSTGFANSSSQYISIFHLYGVSNLVMEDIETYDPPTYGVHCANIVNGSFRNIRGTIPSITGLGNDTMHFNGPVSYITVKDLYSKTNDDALPFNLCDNHVNNSGAALSPDPFGGFVGFGDGTDILVDGVMLDGNSQGIRVLVGNGVRADRVTIRNIKGTCTSFPVALDRAQSFTSGSLGSVTIEDLNVQALQQDTRLVTAGYPPCSIYIQAPIDILNVRNLVRNNPYDNRSSIVLRETISANPAGSIQVLNVNGFSSLGNAAGQASAKLIDIRNGASVGQATLTNINWSSSLSAPGTLVNVASGGTLGPYVISNSILPGNATTTAGAGTISTSSKVVDVLTLTGATSLFADSFTRANASTLGADYTNISGVTPSIVSNTAQIASNATNTFIQITPAGTALVMPTTCTVQYTASQNANMVLWSTGPASYYGYILQWASTGTISLVRQSSGGNTFMAQTGVAAAGTHILKVVRNGNVFTLFVDGTQIGSPYTDGSPLTGTAAYLYSGTGTGTTTYDDLTFTNP